MRYNYEWVADGLVREAEDNLTLEGVLEVMGVEDTWTRTDAPNIVKARAAQDAFVEELKTLNEVGQVAELVENAKDIVSNPEVFDLLTAMGIPVVGVTRVTVASV